MRNVAIKVLLVNFSFLLVLVNCQIRDTSLLRKKRYLIWPSPGINWSQMVVGIGLPVHDLPNYDLPDADQVAVTIGLAFKSLYFLPTNASYYTAPNDIFLANERTLHTRWSLYGHLAGFAARFGYGDGKACILRAICDIAGVPFHKNEGIIGELLNAFFTPSSTKDKVSSPSDHDFHAAERLGKENRADCGVLYPECNNKFMDLFTSIM